MSSMLKKTGGLSFKPKAKARRPGDSSASSSQAPSQSQSQSQASTPAPPSTATPAVTGANSPAELLAEQGPKALSATENPIPVVEFRSQPSTAHATSAVDSTPIQYFQTSKPTTPGTRQDSTEPHATAPSHPTPSADAIAIPPSSENAVATAQAPSVLPFREPDTSQLSQDVPANAGANQSHAGPARLERISEPRALPSPPPTSSHGEPLSSQFTSSEPAVAAAASSANQAPPAVEATSTAAPKKPRQPRKRMAPVEGQGEAGSENGQGSGAAPKAKRQRKPKAASAPTEEAQAESDGDEIGALVPKSFRRRRRRELTPENAENLTIDRSTTKMADLTRDLGIGKKFKHADVILERQREARRNAQLRRLEKQKLAKGLLPSEPTHEQVSRTGTPAAGAEGSSSQADDDAPAELGGAGGGVAYDIIDGQIVVNQNSLAVDQHANHDIHNMETVEEDDFTNITTSASYLRPSRALGGNHWDDESTERFYHYLKMFGTDFETISHVFPGKTRRHIKLKFNREEKQRPKRINAAIMARGAKKVAIDLDDYKSQWRGDAWLEPDKFREEQESKAAEYEEQLEELRQQRRDLGLLDDVPAASAVATGAGDEGTGADGEPETANAEEQGRAIAVPTSTAVVEG